MATAETRSCSNCDCEVTEDSDFCPHCGVIFELIEKVLCETHPERPASTVCIICRATLCKECAQRVRRRFFCNEHCSVEVEEDWAEVYRTHDANDAEMVKSVLAAAGVGVQAQNLSPAPMGAFFGESAVFRLLMRYPAKIFVPIPEYAHAVQVLKDWQSDSIEAGKL